MSESNSVSVPGYIVTKWDEDGEAEVYKPIAKCSSEEIESYVFALRVKVRDLQNEIRNLTGLADGSFELLTDEPMGSSGA